MTSQREKFLHFLKVFISFRDFWVDIGLGIFGGIGFLFGTFALIFIFVKEGIGIPPIILFCMKAFGFWLSGAIVWLAISGLCWAIYFNKYLWNKKKK